MKSSFESKKEVLTTLRPYVMMMNQALGPGWTIRAWENLGWHGDILRGQVHVHYSLYDGGYFTAYLTEGADSSGMPCSWGTPVRHKNPVVAILKAVAEMRKLATEFVRQTCGVEDSALKPAPAMQKRSYRKWLRKLQE